jgi:catechol 2,3-dioxygenase-like lactoylglutathione lyase family enzyme
MVTDVDDPGDETGRSATFRQAEDRVTWVRKRNGHRRTEDRLVGQLAVFPPGIVASIAIFVALWWPPVSRGRRRFRPGAGPTTGALEEAPMSHVRRFDHVGITVADLDRVTTFFVALGLEVEGTRMAVEGAFLDTVIGIPDSRTEIVMLRPPDGGTRLELSSFVRPDHEPGSPAAMANELGLRNVAFEVDDLQAAIDRLATDGYGLVGGIGQYEHIWRMAYVRGPEGIIVSLAERIG